MLWPTSAGGTPERSSACFEATAPSSIAERSFSVPPKVPKPVRTPERNTTSVFEPWVFIGGKLHVRRGEYRRGGGGAGGGGGLTWFRGSAWVSTRSTPAPPSPRSRGRSRTAPARRRTHFRRSPPRARATERAGWGRP